jgi:hypothetical protein
MPVVGALNHAFENAICKSSVSFENFDGGLVHDGLQRVKLSRSGIPCAWRTLLGCCPIMICRLPRTVIQQSTARISPLYHSATTPLAITVTFSTLTPVLDT